jgi:hypothetical protein
MKRYFLLAVVLTLLYVSGRGHDRQQGHSEVSDGDL